MAEWKTYKLSEIATLLTGFPFAGEKYTKEGIRVVRGDNVTIGALRWDSDKLKCWKEPFVRADDFSLMSGDVVIGMDGSRVGLNRAQIKESDLPLFLAQRVACIRHNEKTIQDFLYYQIFSERFVKYIKQVQTGTSIPHVSLKQIGDFEIALPSLEEQRRIAGILGAIDDKIENNRRINTNLELQTQALYKQWFVDNRSDDWEVGKVSDYYDITIGKTPPRKEKQWFSNNPKDFVWVSISDMGSCGAYISNSSEFLTAEAIKRFNIKVIPNNTVLLSFKLTVGRVAISDGVLTTNEAIAHFNTLNDYLTEYTYLALKAYNFANLGSTSSIATAVNSKIIKSMLWVMPNDNVLRDFHNIVAPFFTQIKNNIRENETLATLRDTLLPKLMNGEIITK